MQAAEFGLSGVDLEALDPTPDIHALFVHYNHLYFNNMLGACCVEWSTKRMTLCAGQCHFSQGGGCRIRLSEPLLKFRPARDLKDVLLHEMIHAAIFLSGVRDDGDHGSRFQARMNAINSASCPDSQRPPGGYKITVFHTMHAEVDNYRTHVWRCSSCGSVTKRSMNRRPQEADCRMFSKKAAASVAAAGLPPGSYCTDDRCWYHSHVKTCGGEYVKISEPEKQEGGQAAGATSSKNNGSSQGMAAAASSKRGKKLPAAETSGNKTGTAAAAAAAGMLPITSFFGKAASQDGEQQQQQQCDKQADHSQQLQATGRQQQQQQPMGAPQDQQQQLEQQQGTSTDYWSALGTGRKLGGGSQQLQRQQQQQQQVSKQQQVNKQQQQQQQRRRQRPHQASSEAEVVELLSSDDEGDEGAAGVFDNNSGPDCGQHGGRQRSNSNHHEVAGGAAGAGAKRWAGAAGALQDNSGGVCAGRGPTVAADGAAAAPATVVASLMCPVCCQEWCAGEISNEGLNAHLDECLARMSGCGMV